MRKVLLASAALLPLLGPSAQAGWTVPHSFANDSTFNLSTLDLNFNSLATYLGTNSFLTANQGFTGTSSTLGQGLLLTLNGGGSIGSPFAFNVLSVTGDNINAGTASVADLTLSDSFGGSLALGARYGLLSNLTLASTTALTNTVRVHSAVQGNGTAGANDNGSSPASYVLAAGDMSGVTGVGASTSGATSLLSVSGVTGTANLQSGSSAWARSIFRGFAPSTAVVAGSVEDNMLWLYNSSVGAAKFKYGIYFDDLSQNGSWPILSSGTIIGAAAGAGSATAATGVDFTGVTFSGNAFQSNAFSVTQAGLGNFGASIYDGNGVSTGTANVEIGGLRSGSGPANLDFWSATGSPTFSITKAAGANGALNFTNFGTGTITFTTSSATNYMTIGNLGNVTFPQVPTFTLGATVQGAGLTVSAGGIANASSLAETSYAVNANNAAFCTTIPAGNRVWILDTGGTDAACQVKMQAAPVDGQVQTVVSQIAFTGSHLTIVANTAQTVVVQPVPAAPAAASSWTCRYVSSSSKWYCSN